LATDETISPPQAALPPACLEGKITHRVGAAQPLDADAAHHQLFFANCLAQNQALMQGVQFRRSPKD